jgi:hypothetical protein
MDFTGFSAEIFSGLAVVISLYSLWRTALQHASLNVFVPPIIRYASPYQNSVFEVFEIPMTVVNEGALTGTILSFNLEVMNPRHGVSKQFYSAAFGAWSLEKAQGESINGFTPISLIGRGTQAATILFFARHDSEIQQIVDGPGPYEFRLTPLMAQSEQRIPIGRSTVPQLTFTMNLPYLDHRAFTTGSGTIQMNHPEWAPSAA